MASECSDTQWEDSKIGLRVGGIFIILLTSMFGVLLPILARRIPGFQVPPSVFDFAKYAGSGVIIATSFIHLLAPAFEALSSDCLSGAWTVYPWPSAIAMFSIFALFFVEFFSFRLGTAKLKASGIIGYDNHGHDLEGGAAAHAHTAHGVEPARVISRISIHQHQHQHQHTHNHEHSEGEVASNGKVSDGGDELDVNSMDKAQVPDEGALAQILGVMILEFGVVFHSIFIGLTLATDKSFTILFIVIIFHQMFEGLGLGARLAFLPLPSRLNWVPLVMGVVYAFVTPVGMAIGLGARYSYRSNANGALIANGVLDSISAGILLWTALVELMAHEFLFNPEMQKASNGKVLYAFSCMIIGCGVMSLLGRWA